MNTTHDIADPGLASAGSARIDWAWAEMPVLRLSATTGEGLDAWVAWLEARVAATG